MTYQSTKTYTGFPCAHRQPRHDGNCALVHGYSRSFEFIFQAETRDKCGFVVDFGDLKWLREHLDYMFDHTLLLVPDDPLLPQFKELEAAGACAIRLLPYGVGMEDTAQYLCEWTDSALRRITKGRAWVVTVEARENEKNSAIYINPYAGFRGWL
jgi:6-pyruvoyltetrahydropterin/6-carboxytetrahydropterin synthase